MDAITEEELNEALEKNKRYAYQLGGANFGPDLESAGREAIVRAMQTYDRSKGKFPSYARWFIRKFQIRERKEILTAVHLPTNLYIEAPGVGLELIAELPAEETKEKGDYEAKEDGDYEELYKALAKLDDKSRGLIEDHFLKEKDYAEIQAERGWAYNTVRSYMYVAVAKLAKIVKEKSLHK